MPLRTKHIYYADGKLLAEEWGANLIVFLYDESGMPIGMQYRTSSYASGKWDAYWFERNLHGDVVAIYNNSNTKLASYLYDAWGNHTVTYHNGGGSLTAIVNNPIRYRGYYYDIDLGLYYLQTRYYDSNIGRFINADGYISTGSGLLGYNMYAYCNNNPVMYVDPSGEFLAVSAAAILKGLLFLVTALFVLDVVANVEVPRTITKSESGAKAEEKDVTIVDSPEKTERYNYWSATISNGVVTPVSPLTYSEARQWAAAEGDIVCRDHASAIAIVKFYPSAIWESAHGGGVECGYLNHYHLSTAHKNHIWYYGE